MHEPRRRFTDACRGGTSLGARMLLLVLLSAPACAFGAAPTSMPALGQHTLLVQADGLGTGTVGTAPLATQASGSSLVLLVGGYADNRDGPSDSYANRWKALGRPVVYRGFDGRFDVKAYVALNASGGPAHTVHLLKAATPKGEITAPFVEIAHAGVLQAVAQNYPQPGALRRAADRLARLWSADGGATTLTSQSVTTTGPATLLAVWWGDSRALRMTALPGDGFRLIDRYLDLPPQSGVQCAVAVRQVASAGTYRVSWTVAPAQGAILWLFAFQSAPRATAQAPRARPQTAVVRTRVAGRRQPATALADIVS